MLWYLKATAWLPCSVVREISDRMGYFWNQRLYSGAEFNNPEKITVFDKEHKEVAAYMPPAQGPAGYEYEVEACARAIAQGEKECQGK